MVSLVAEYDGDAGPIFTYVRSYHFQVLVGRHLYVPSGERTEITITGLQRGGPTTWFEDRPFLAVRLSRDATPPLAISGRARPARSARR